MGSISICRVTVAAIVHNQSFNSSNNVTRASSRRVSRSLLKSLPRGLADYSSQSSLYISRSEILKLAGRDGGAYLVRVDGRGGRIVCAKGSDNGTPRPEYRFPLRPCCVFLLCGCLSLSDIIDCVP